MAIAKARGAKRKCQNDDCALPFYDLNREAFDCPNCGTSYDIELEAREREAAAEASASGYRPRRKAPELTIVAPEGPAAIAEDESDDDEDDELPGDPVSPDEPLLDDDDEEIDDIAPTRPDGGSED
jgi:uncharacterized protein (TIGR02300 family)